MGRTKASSDTSEQSPKAPVKGATDDGVYRVVARRYRPQSFDEVVGQDHVVQTLRNAIKLNRVTHAYLFTGTRGVGKTSIARIFAKCLNCVTGPTDSPCNTCDICQAVSVGQDVDVIEIDGASNNGVDQVRELRQNASLRPSRGRFKIYYIDEVHMLSKGAFDALLKTLEEPPEHVKFFFATTEPGKIPETVRSRCQRYDFAGISPQNIAETLESICAKEGVEADADALHTIARRAAGSMRDAQSLLEQALSFEGRHITNQLVHEALGLAPDEGVLELLEAIAARDPAIVLKYCDRTLASGVQPGDLLNALLGFVRDVMVVSAGAETRLLDSAPSAHPRLAACAKSIPLETSLAMLQVLAEARNRMRGSPHGRLLVELALCRCARLSELVEIESLVERLRDFSAPSQSSVASSKKKPVIPEASKSLPEITSSGFASSSNGVHKAERTQSRPADALNKPSESLERVDFKKESLSLETFQKAWPFLKEALPASIGGSLAKLEPSRVIAPATLVVFVPASYNFMADQLEKPKSSTALDVALRELLGRAISVRFERSSETEKVPKEQASVPSIGRHEDLDADPLVQDMIKLFDARAVRIQTDEEAEAS